uniref:Ciliary neurotrophic factor receptor subunit alpha n=1 Tax=Sphenodon punctatus TaxID=8508 RepID=A0A8D0H128_SPHPU
DGTSRSPLSLFFASSDTHIQYARMGTDVTMQCGAMDWDASVTWTANGTDIDESHLNGSQLVLRNVDLTHSGQYFCYEGSSWHLKYQTTLKVGTPPKEPMLMCRSNNYPRGFYCSWHLPSPTYIPNAFNITVMHDSKEMVCEKDTPPKNRCHIRYLQLFSTKRYKVTLTVTNALGRSSYTITFDEFAIVKPDPPENVVAKPVPNNPRRLEVTWQNPSSWPDPDSFPLKFFLRYRPLIIDQWQHVSELRLPPPSGGGDGERSLCCTDRIRWAALDHRTGMDVVQSELWTSEPRSHIPTHQCTTTTSTSSFAAPPTTKICDQNVADGNGAVTAVSWEAGLVLTAFSILLI